MNKFDNTAVKAAEKSQKRLFKYKRAGQVLSKDEVERIKEGRKKLRRDMREAGIKSKKEFEYNAANLGLYFDSSRGKTLFMFLQGRLLWALLAASGTLLLGFLAASGIAELRGHFTINLTDDLFKAGFMLAEEPEFKDPSSNLYSDLVTDAPCISIVQIPHDVDQRDGSHNGIDHFAYTFYVKYEGEEPASYSYQLKLSSEGKSLSVATWAMLFLDGKMTMYAKCNSNGEPEAIPDFDDNTRGYTEVPFLEVASDPAQFQEIARINDVGFYRLIPKNFVSDIVVCDGLREDVNPGDVHKYTVVIWLEGDDPDCTNELIGGHIGLEMDLALVSGSH